MIVGLVLLVLLIVFSAENTRSVKMRVIGPEIHAPLFLALLIAAVVGVLIGLIIRRIIASGPRGGVNVAGLIIRRTTLTAHALIRRMIRLIHTHRITSTGGVP